MIRLVLSRLVWSLPLLVVASAFTFVLVSLIPGDPAATILGPQASADQTAALREQLGLNQPLWTQYADWLSHAVRGDLGTSLNGEDVRSLLSTRLTVSLSLIIGAVVVASVLGVLLGTVAAARGGWIGNVVQVASTASFALPSFWLGLILIELFALRLPLLPATGYVELSQDPSGWLRSLVLPVVTIALGAMTGIAVQTRDSMADVLGRDFVRVLEGNGIRRRSVVFRHALRNAAIPVVTVIALTFVGLLSGAILVESVFALPGLGSELSSAAGNHDVGVIEAIVLYFTLIIVVMNLLVDIVQGAIDPRLRTR